LLGSLRSPGASRDFGVERRGVRRCCGLFSCGSIFVEHLLTGADGSTRSGRHRVAATTLSRLGLLGSLRSPGASRDFGVERRGVRRCCGLFSCGSAPLGDVREKRFLLRPCDRGIGR
jgi:hypothetical protein